MRKIGKILFLVLPIIIASGSVFSYVTTKSFIPWDFVDGINCPLAGFR